MSRCAGLNRGPLPYHGSALPTELQRQNDLIIINSLSEKYFLSTIVFQ